MKKLITAHGLTFESYISQSEITHRLQAMGQQITADYKGKNPLFIGVLNGAFIFMADLVRHCEIPCEIAFVRLASYEGTASTGTVKTVYGLDVPIKDRHIIVAEDIIDSGRTLHYFMDSLAAKEPASLALATLLYKPAALQFPVKSDYTGFEIPEKFVVGYGLDYNGLCRNLPDIYQLKSEKA